MNIENKSYVYGLLGADGCLRLESRNRGSISMEISKRDEDIVHKLSTLIPNSIVSERTRNTNFKDNYQSITFANYHKPFRDMLIDFGYPTKDKKNLLTTPSSLYSKRDFWRGIIDADGSIGYTSDGSPFVSLVVVGESLKDEYLNLLDYEFGIVKNVKRNVRDSVYNITVKHEDALSLSNYLYKDSCLYIDRKYNSYLTLLSWKRTSRKLGGRSFSDAEVDYILRHSIEECMEELGRSRSSIYMKKQRLSIIESNN